MKKYIFRVQGKDLLEAVAVAQTFDRWYNNPAAWDKKKIAFERVYTVHETKTGTVVVGYNNG